MKKKHIVFQLSILLFTCHPIKSQSVKGLYVDGFSSILGITITEDSLLNYAQYNGFNYLALYDLWTVHTTYNLTTSGTCTVLANFIQRAKQNFGILQVGAVGENFFFFNNVIKIYNQQHVTLQKFDVYNVEFEFWNTNNVSAGNYYCTTYLQPGGYSCDTAGAFNYFKRLIFKVDSIANIAGVISETYVGWFNQGQAITIGNTVDRILLHDYISNYAGLYSYIQPRLQLIAGRNVLTNVIPIFSAEPSFMGPWLSTHNVLTTYNDIQTALTNETGTWKQYINLMGYQWFAYSFMPYNVVSSGILNIEGGEIVFYPNPASDYLIIKNTTLVFVNVKLFNDIGGEVNVKKIEGNSEITIDLSKLTSGIYFCAIQSGDLRIVKKLIKE